MSTTDEELDKLFRDAATNAPTPEYKPEFFADIERQLPVKKAKRSLAWWWTANLFLVAFIAWTSVEVFRMIIPVGNESLVGKNEQKKKTNYTSAKTGHTAKRGKENSRSGGNKENITGPVKEKSAFEVSRYKSNSVGGEFSNLEVQTNAIENFVNREEKIEKSEIAGTETVEAETKETESLDTETENSEKGQNSEEINLGLSRELNLIIRDLNSEFTNAELLPGRMNEVSANRFSYFAELDLGVEQAWMKSEEENSSSVNGNFGINGGLIFTYGKIRYSAGLGVNYTKFDDLKIKERSIIYGFGSNILENTYAFNGLLAVTIPVRAEYVLGRHSLDLNLATSYNLVTMVHRYQHIDGEEIVSRNGYSSASLLNHFGLKPMIGYSYFAKENTQIGFRMGAQLLTPVQSDRFIGSPVKMPLEGQFYIRQTIPTKK